MDDDHGSVEDAKVGGAAPGVRDGWGEGAVAFRPYRSGTPYGQLQGGEGPEVLFRSLRYASEELEPAAPNVLLRQGEQESSCPLHDVSQSGLAFYWPASEPVEVGQTLTLRLTFGGHDAYSGRARVRSVRDQEGRTLVGASFLDSLMNIADVMDLRDVNLRLTAGLFHLSAAGWRTPGYEPFKALLCEFRLFLEDAATSLAQVEKELPPSVVAGGTDSAARSALVERLHEVFVPEFVDSTERLDRACRQADRKEARHLREISLRTVQDLLLQAPFIHRGLHKPLGYPGDFELMRCVYDRQFEGSTLFGRAVHLATVWTRAGQAARGRKELLRGLLHERAQRHAAEGRRLRVASIAAGPCQEIFEFLSALTEVPCPVDLLLFDQDALALDFAYGRLLRLPILQSKNLRLRFLRDSIRRLLADTSLFESYGPFDLVYASGLVDYLPFGAARRLGANLYGTLAPGGALLLGNLVRETPCRWLLEYHMDWELTYRSHDELLEIGNAAVPEAEIDVVDDPTHLNPFLRLRKA